MRTRLTHPLSVSHLVVGLVFLGVAGSWALRSAGILDSGDFGWMLPLVLVAAGTIGLVALAARTLHRDRHRDADGLAAYDEHRRGPAVSSPTTPPSEPDRRPHGSRTRPPAADTQP